MQAHLLSLNNFGMPKVYSGTDAIYTNIIYLIMLEPGKFQSHPNMGVGIRSKYRHNNDENMLQTLRMDIQDQIERFLPDLTDIDITVTSKNAVLGIIINTENGVYTMAYNTSTDLMEAPATYILDEL